MIEILSTFREDDVIIWDVSWSPTMNQLVYCTSDQTIGILEFDDNFKIVDKNIFEKMHTKSIRSLSWSPCGNMIAAGSFDSLISVWSLTQNRANCIASIEGHESEVKCIAWDSSGTFLASCGRDCSIWIWEFVPPDEFQCINVLKHHTQDIKKVIFHPYELLLASCSYDGKIMIYEPDHEDEWYLTDTLSGHDDTVWSCQFRPCGNFLVSCSSDLKLIVWDMKRIKRYPHLVDPNSYNYRKQNIFEFKTPHCYDVFNISWSNDGNYLATCSQDNSIAIYLFLEMSDLKITLLTHFKNAHSQDINSIKWCSSEKFKDILASSSDDGTINIYKFKHNNTLK